MSIEARLLLPSVSRSPTLWGIARRMVRQESMRRMSLSSARASLVKRGGYGAVIVSIAVHAGIATLLVPALMVPRHFERIFGTTPERESVRERIVSLAPAPRHSNTVSDTAAATDPMRSSAGPIAEPSRLGPVEPATAPGDTTSLPIGGIAGGDRADPGGVVIV